MLFCPAEEVFEKLALFWLGGSGCVFLHCCDELLNRTVSRPRVMERVEGGYPVVVGVDTGSLLGGVFALPFPIELAQTLLFPLLQGVVGFLLDSVDRADEFVLDRGCCGVLDGQDAVLVAADFQAEGVRGDEVLFARPGVSPAFFASDLVRGFVVWDFGLPHSNPYRDGMFSGVYVEEVASGPEEGGFSGEAVPVDGVGDGGDGPAAAEAFLDQGVGDQERPPPLPGGNVDALRVVDEFLDCGVRVADLRRERQFRRRCWSWGAGLTGGFGWSGLRVRGFHDLGSWWSGWVVAVVEVVAAFGGEGGCPFPAPPVEVDQPAVLQGDCGLFVGVVGFFAGRAFGGDPVQYRELAVVQFSVHDSILGTPPGISSLVAG